MIEQYQLKDRAKDVAWQIREQLDTLIEAEVENIDELLIDEHSVSLDEEEAVDVYNSIYDGVLDLLRVRYNGGE